MPTLRALLLSLLLLPALTGCLDCRDRTCDCFSEGEDDVALYFDRDSLAQGFRRAELAGAYLLRYAAPGFGIPRDTIRPRSRYEQDYTFTSFGVTLNHALSLPGQPFTAFSYAVVLPQANRRYQVSELEIAGETRGNRCCQCYRNTRKRLRLDGAYRIADGQRMTDELVLRR